jgi:hypothetical protein
MWVLFLRCSRLAVTAYIIKTYSFCGFRVFESFLRNIALQFVFLLCLQYKMLGSSVKWNNQDWLDVNN